MASVYSSAYSGLVIWLGVGSAASDWTMDIIQQPPPRPEHVLDIAPFRAVRSVDDLKANEIYLLYALAVIAQSGYWRRLWIIQEIVLGTRPKVRFGTKETTLKQPDTFLDVCNRMVYAVKRRRDHLENITRPVVLRPRTDRSVKLGDQTIAGPEIQSLLSLKEEHNREKLLQFADEMKLNWNRLWVELGQILPMAQCKEPRDHIFSMLDLVDRDVQVEVDYGKSLELIAEQVLKKQLIEYLIVENRFEVQDWRKDEFMKFAGILAEMLRIPGWVEEARKIIHAEAGKLGYHK